MQTLKFLLKHIPAFLFSYLKISGLPLKMTSKKKKKTSIIAGCHHLQSNILALSHWCFLFIFNEFLITG